MKSQTIVLTLAIAASALLFVLSLAAIVLDDGGSTYMFTSAQGEIVNIYGGLGPYRYDTMYKAIAFRSFDLVSLVIVLPLFLAALRFYLRGQMKGRLLLAALFTYLAYIYLIGFMGNAFNGLFLGWVALFSLGCFGLFQVVSEINLPALPQQFTVRFPVKPVAVYMLAVAAILSAQYLAEIFGAYITGSPPSSLDHYTTLELAGLELGIMIPLHILAGLLLWRQNAWGYLLSTILAFAASMVFIALSISLLIPYFGSARGNLADLAITLSITIVAAGFSLAIFRQIRD